jgi:transposase-like protein
VQPTLSAVGPLILRSPCRDIEYCTGFVTACCARGTLVVTDEWAGYNGLPEAGFQHKTVCHKREFVSADGGWHTQRIEGMWSALKRWLSAHGYTVTDRTAEYIGEYSCRFNLHRSPSDIRQVLFS